jgi:hypothetical protein
MPEKKSKKWTKLGVLKYGSRGGGGGGRLQVSLKNKRFGENAEKIEKVDREQVGYIYEMKRSEDLRCYPW